ncbi:MAG TPA: hypothetical protein VKN76_03340, partial [Kiloniellaceae bacterium]|nr:hypothetical protein [Kiloniellaceae bacterium]
MKASDLRRTIGLSSSFFLLMLATAYPASPSVAAGTESYATGETPIFGTLNSGSVSATFAADGTYEKIAESKDATGHYRLAWQWTFDVAAGASYALHAVAQATNTKHGMDFYQFSVRRGDSDWVPLGQVTQTTMTTYVWPFPDGDYSGPIILRAVDSNHA